MSKTPETDALLRTKPAVWRKWTDPDFCDLEYLAKSFELDRNRLRDENARLRSALDRLYNATATLLQSKPIHDMDEVFAEARAALKG